MEEDIKKSLQRWMHQGHRSLMKKPNLEMEKEKVEKQMFFMAIQSGNNRLVYGCLLKGADPNATDEHGRSGLHMAALGSHQDIVNALLTKGADPEQRDEQGITPLMCASQVGSDVIVDQLLQRNVDVTKKTKDGLSAVFYALYNGHTKIAKRLEEKQSCIHQIKEKSTVEILAKAVTKNWIKVVHFMHDKQCDVSYRNKLILASQAGLCGHTELLKYFPVKYDDKVDDDGRSPLRCAVQNGFYDAVEYMLDNGCDISNNEECVKVAILTCHLDVLRLLREKGAPISTYYEENEVRVTPLQLAVVQGSFEMFKYLVDQGCLLDSHEQMGSLALMATSMRQSELLEILEYLVEKKAEIDVPHPDSGETPLLAVSQKGPIEVVEFLLDQKCNYDIQNHRGVTPALRAAHNKQEDILMLLGERGADLDIPNRIGETAILCAARNKSLSMVRFLADNGCRLDTKDINGHTVAFYAVQTNNVALLNFLQQRNVFLDEPDRNGMTPLTIAVRNKSFDAVRQLTSGPNLCAIDHKDQLGRTAAHHAIIAGLLDMVKYLHEKKCDLATTDHIGNTLLLAALERKNCCATLEFLIDAKCDLGATNDDLSTAMHYACKKQENDALMLLLENGCAFDTQDRTGMTPFMICSAQGSESFVTVLKSVGADVHRRNHSGENAVHLAAKCGNLKIVQFLSLFGCVMDQEDSSGVTPLIIACSGDRLEMAKFLLKKRADVNAVTHNGRKPVHFACSSGSLGMLKLLHSNGAHLDSPDLCGVTPIMLAAAKQSVEFLEFLHTNGCEINAADKTMRTALHYAVEGKNETVVQFLIGKGLDPNALDESGTSPILLSIKMNSGPILSLLRSKGGKIDETFDVELRSAAHFACQTGNVSLLQELKGQVSFSSRTRSGESCLTIACSSGSEEVVKYLLQQRVHVNYRNALGDTALIAAAKASQLNLIPLLIQSGVRVQETNHEGSNVAHILCGKPCSSISDKVGMLKMETNEHLDDFQRMIESDPNSGALKPGFLKLIEHTRALPDQLVKTRLAPGCVSKKAVIDCLSKLFDAGVDPNAVNKEGKGALHFAAAVGSKGIIRFLLSKDAALDVRDSKGETPLFYAIRNGKEKIVQLLLQRGAEFSIENNDGLSAMSLALALNSQKAVELLRQKGAEFSIKHVVDTMKLKDLFKQHDISHLEFLLSSGFDGKKTENGTSLLHHAVLAREVRLLRSLKSSPRCTFIADIVDAQNEEGNTALHLAIMGGRLDIAEVLLQMKCRVDLRNGNGHMPMHVAAAENKLSLVLWLGDHCPEGIQPNATDPAGTLSPLQISAAMGNLSVFKYLVEKGFSAEATCSNRSNCAHYAAVHGNLHILNYMHIQDRNSICFQSRNAQNLTPLECAVLNGHEMVADFLLQHSDPAMPDSAVYLAAQRGHQRMVEWIEARLNVKLDALGHEPNTGESAVRFSVASGNLHMVKKIVGNRADWQNDCNEHRNSLAQGAAFFNHRHVLRFLNEQNAPMDLPNLDGDTAALECAIKGHLESLKMLQEFGCDLKRKNAKQRDIVHLACIGSGDGGHLNIVKFASDQQLPLDDADDQGNSGLMYACRQGFKDIADFLLSTKKCDPRRSNLRGSTAAHLAVMAGQADILEVLSQHGARLNAEDGDGTTPLMIAVRLSGLECVALLVEKAGLGDDANRRNRCGWTVQRLAAHATPEVQRLMEDRGVQPQQDNDDEGQPITQDQELLDISLELCSHPQRELVEMQDGQNVAVETVPVNSDDGRSTYFGDIRCKKPNTVQDHQTLTEANSTVNNGEDNAGAEPGNDEDDDDGDQQQQQQLQPLGLGAGLPMLPMLGGLGASASPPQPCAQQ